MMLIVLTLSAVIVILLFWYTTRHFSYWNKRNVKHDPPLLLFGTHFKNLFAIKSITEVSIELYNKYRNEKVVGYYRGSTPELIIKDLDIVRNILSVDFLHFYQRGIGRNPEVEPLFYNLFQAEGDIWKLLRQRMTPAFTTAKLKAMFPLIVSCAEKLHAVGDDIADNGGEFDARDFMARFTTDFIGACGFGIEMDSINNEQSAFRELGIKIFTRSFFDTVWVAIWEMVPAVRNKMRVLDSDIEDAIADIVTTIFKQRNNKPSGRNDFIDLLLELTNKGKIEGESIERTNNGVPEHAEIEFTLLHIVAQVFIFFVAGFETSSSSTSATLYQLALNPDIQTEVQNEVDQVLAKYNNKLCYDAVAEMTLLDMSFKEAIRIFPSVGVLQRKCVKQYTIPQLGITIDPGVRIVIPVQAIHNDKRHFENPEEFNPYRFSPNSMNNLNKYAFLPFGEGPRACIGSRLGHMQSLAGLAAVLQKFRVEVSSRTPTKFKVNPRINIIQNIVGGIPLKLKSRKQ